jgi:hypothetical protein
LDDDRDAVGNDRYDWMIGMMIYIIEIDMIWMVMILIDMIEIV